jgi:hypothetical protein
LWKLEYAGFGDGESELRYEIFRARNRRKVEYTGAKMILSMMASVIASTRASMMMLAVIVSMRMAPVVMASMIMVSIMHDGLPDDVDDDGIDGEGELRYEIFLARNRRNLEYAGSKMIILMIISMMASMMLVVMVVIVSMRMASVTMAWMILMIMVSIMHDGLPDDVNDVIN